MKIVGMKIRARVRCKVEELLRIGGKLHDDIDADADAAADTFLRQRYLSEPGPG